MEGLDVICAQNWVEQFWYNLAHHGLSFYSYSLDSLHRRVSSASNYVYYAFNWSHTAQHSDGTYHGPWHDRRNNLAVRKLLTR